jgi:hypothetical protein
MFVCVRVLAYGDLAVGFGEGALGAGGLRGASRRLEATILPFWDFFLLSFFSFCFCIASHDSFFLRCASSSSPAFFDWRAAKASFFFFFCPSRCSAEPCDRKFNWMDLQISSEFTLSHAMSCGFDSMGYLQIDEDETLHA